MYAPNLSSMRHVLRVSQQQRLQQVTLQYFIQPTPQPQYARIAALAVADSFRTGLQRVAVEQELLAPWQAEKAAGWYGRGGSGKEADVKLSGRRMVGRAATGGGVVDVLKGGDTDDLDESDAADEK